MSSEDDFMDIVKNNDLEKYMEESESYNLTVKDIHFGIKNLAECIMFLTDFVTSFFSFVDAGDEDERPALSLGTVHYAKELFDMAEKFCDSIVDEIMFEDDEDDEDEDDFEDDEDE